MASTFSEVFNNEEYKAKVIDFERKEQSLVQVVSAHQTEIDVLELHLLLSSSQLQQEEAALNMFRWEQTPRFVEAYRTGNVIAIDHLLKIEQEFFARMHAGHQNHTTLTLALQLEKAEMQQARDKLAANRRDRARLEDEHPHSLALHYSRECSICTTTNPRKRAVLVKCGHQMCVPCAQVLAGNKEEFRCPLCQKETGFIKIFEDLKEEEKRGQKRKHEE